MQFTYLVLLLNFICYIKCFIPSLTVQKVDNKIIQKKRRDTLEMCKIFNEQNHYKDDKVRVKRDATFVENPALNDEDIQRVEDIIDEMYDDYGEKVSYRRRNGVTSKKTDAVPKRRYDFAPATLTISEEKLESKLHPQNASQKKIQWIKKWKHGIVPYYIDSNTYDVQLADVIMKAFDYFERATCIRLQRLRDKPLDEDSLQKVEWLYISNPSGIRQCVHSNEVKPNTGVQMVVFGYDCMSLGEITHEIMHILGFSHEHTRPDRDQHITILWDNIKPGYKNYFSIQDHNTLGLPYDFASVLHYPPRAFSKNGHFTIVPESGLKIGQRQGLSETDVEKVSVVYNYDCEERNNDYLLKTCPSAVRSQGETKSASKEEIDDYFKDRIWPYGIINYKIKDDLEFTVEEKENIKAVIKHIEKESCIKFKSAETEVVKDSDSSSEESPKHKMTLYDSVTEASGNKVEAPDVTEQAESKEKVSADTEHVTSKETTGSNEKTPPNDKENEIKSDNEKLADEKNNTTTASNRVKRRAYIPSRRHAENIITLVRSTEPGCKCPTPGRPNGNLDLVINDDCFNSVNDLLHLFMHVAGFDHQHNTHDRDSYIKIQWDQATTEAKQEMENTLPPAASAGFSYDYQSVMHYPWLQIKYGVRNTMYPVWNDGWSMGHWQGLSATDVQKINFIYNKQCSDREKESRRRS